jgi:hypothetical protein
MWSDGVMLPVIWPRRKARSPTAACSKAQRGAQFLREHRSATLLEMSARASCSSNNNWTKEEIGKAPQGGSRVQEMDSIRLRRNI